jgi:hypothetical protein
MYMHQLTVRIVIESRSERGTSSLVVYAEHKKRGVLFIVDTLIVVSGIILTSFVKRKHENRSGKH